MIQIQNPQDCCGCGACAQICPNGCIAMTADEEGFLYPHVDTASCIQCGLCEALCPVIHAEKAADQGLPSACAARHTDPAIRRKSSSGGVFTALADHILSEGGVVFGAALTADFRRVRHIAVEEPDGLQALRGSKYVQSDTGDAYIQARQFLEEGRKVLFTGTPCQIEGLRAYLKKEHPNLYCMDFICHGVPSPLAWSHYVDHRQKRAGAPLEQVSFRDKAYGWKSYCLHLSFANGSVYRDTMGGDVFLHTFLSNLSLRPSCYRCAFRKASRVSDLTAADFWGCEYICPQLDDDQGLSLVLIQSRRGEDLLQAAGDSLLLHPVDAEAALFSNPALIRSPEEPAQRALFFRDRQILIQPDRWHHLWPRQSFAQRALGRIPPEIKDALRRLRKNLRSRRIPPGKP